MARITYNSFITTKLVQNGDQANETNLNKAPIQLKEEIDLNYTDIQSHESRLSSIESGSAISGTTDKFLKSGTALSITGNTITLTKGDNTTDTISVSSTDTKLSDLTFNTSTGILTAVLSDTSSASIDLDGRYSLLSHTHNYNSTVGTDTDIILNNNNILNSITLTDGVITSFSTKTFNSSDFNVQDKLVSGYNIKQINGKSIIGSGTIDFIGTSGPDNVFFMNELIITQSYTVPSNVGAMSTGPITVNTGITVTVSDNARWVVL